MAEKFPSKREYVELLEKHESGIHFTSLAGKMRCDVQHRASREITIEGGYFANKRLAEADTMAKLAKRKSGSSVKAMAEEIDEKDALIDQQAVRIAELEGRAPKNPAKPAAPADPPVDDEIEQDGEGDEPAEIGDGTLIEDTPLPIKTTSALQGAGIKTVGELTKLTEETLGNLKGIGTSSFQVITAWLDENGLGLAEEPDPDDTTD